MTDGMATRHNEPEVRTVLEWTPDSCKSAETLADSGDLSRAADLCERIGADDRVEGVLLQRASIARLPLDFEGGSPAAVKALRDDGDFWRICPMSQLATLHRWHALLGVSLGRLSFVDAAGKPRMRGKLHAPIVEAWSSPRHLTRLATGEWHCQVGTGATVPVDPGADGWLLWKRSDNRPWAQGAWRAARLWWLLKQYAIQDWARYSERHGQGTWVLIPGETTDLSTKELRRELAREFKTLGRDAVAILRQGWDAKLVESVANNHTTFQEQINFANAGLAISVLGQNLTSEVKSGSFAAGKVHENVAANIIASDAESLSDFAHDQILVPWALANWGSTEAAPWPVWNATPPSDTAAKVKAWVDLGTALTTFRTLGVPVDYTAACEDAGVPLEAGAAVPTAEDQAEAEREAAEERSRQADENLNGGIETTEEELADDGTDEDQSASASARHRHQHAAPRASLVQRPGERSGQEYSDRVAESIRAAIAEDLAPHLDELVRLVGQAEGPRDYARVRYEIENYYREKMSPSALAAKVRAGLTMAQAGGWAAVRVDAPELSRK